PTGEIGISAEERIRRALSSPTEIDFVDTPLRDALNYLKDKHVIQIWPDEQALTDQGVAIDTPVTLSLAGVRLASALDLLLTPLHLDYMIDDEVLKITTQAREQETWQLEVYSVRDLLEQGFNPDELRDVLTASVTPQAWVENGGQASLRIARENLLIVRHTPRSQRELVRALDKLRAGMRDER
ncbi:MAG TPA: hypothetical protein VHB77_08940, partial [Planctomycetaceae bacterium]|nr:hypothetical protein [Planctomycetaceae bacterium]